MIDDVYFIAIHYISPPTGAYITNVLTSYYEREENAIKISDKRTLALRGYPTGCERVLPASTAANLFP